MNTASLLTFNSSLTHVWKSCDTTNDLWELSRNPDIEGKHLTLIDMRGGGVVLPGFASPLQDIFSN
jgi:hypothetical protein